MTSHLHLFLFYFFLFHLTTLGFAATPKLHSQEVRALRDIGRKLGKTDWDFNKDPCSGQGNWSVPESSMKGFESVITCDCTFEANSSCHVVSIALKSQNLSAGLPPEFSRFRHLQRLDLARNYLNGTIPSQWSSMRLVELSLMGNRLSGAFPNVLTNITTLTNMSIEGNQFSGPIPNDIGKLVNLQKLVLSSNSLTGRLPMAVSKLTQLSDMRISDNNFSGTIPDFIGNWTRIEKLHMQGCSLEGPIPSTINLLTSLTDLRISDLKGRGSNFPTLSNLESIKTLTLRNCLLDGEIPSYIGHMSKLKSLDLSFNNLTGEIPITFVKLAKADYIFLTRNKLSGPIPGWILSRNKNIDLSYNNFTWESSNALECPRGSVNLVESYSSSANNINRVHPCLKQHYPCSSPTKERYYSLYINCGGKEVIIKDKKYEADLEARGASMFYTGQKNWAFSSTGKFMDNDADADLFIDTNVSSLLYNNVSRPYSELYTTSRISPLSLTYYGLCLMNGNYTVRLHFAEIVFTHDHSFNSLGKRVFDVYIQEELVLKDFNIDEAAGEVGIPIVKNFTVAVQSHTLKINFYWAGRGTTGIPLRGNYGPLISAISVDPNFKPPTLHKRRIQIIEVVAILSGSSFFLLLLLVVLWRNGCLGGKSSVYKELEGLELQTGLFTLKQIKTATNNFDLENKLGEGGFGAVYKGELSDGKIIAVKQLSAKSKQGAREFVNEIGMISTLQHPNLVKLYGCCVEGNQLALIYEYMENNCLSRILFGRETDRKVKLDWIMRQKICLGIARGLAYLHDESIVKIVHRDIKTSNILLDKDFNAKISDFGLAKLNEGDNTHISTRVAGTIGYMAPEYAMRGYLTDKADVYSFGVVALELVSGKSNTNYRPVEDFVYLLDWAYVLQERGSLLELVDPSLGSEYSSGEAMVMLNIALLCTNASPTLRPTMCQVVSMLEGRTPVQDLLSDPGFSTIDSKLKAIRNHFWQTMSVSSDGGPYADSSSASNLDREESVVLVRVGSVFSDK